MNFRKIVIFSFLAILFVALLALPTFAKDVIEEEDSPYSLIVGDVYVTDANKADILGDGTAVFDSENYVLTIKNFKSDTTSTVTVDSQTGYKSFFSVFYPGEKDLTVKIEGNCHFMSAVRVDHGTIEIKDANVTFSEFASAMFESEYGLISVRNSEITVENVEYIAPLSEDREGMCRAISAASIEVYDSKITCDVENPTMNAYHDAFVYAYNDLIIENSKVSVSAPFSVFKFVFYAGSGIFGMENTDIIVERQAIPFVSISKVFSAINCDINVKECENAIAAASLSLKDCSLTASTFFDAITLQSDEDLTSSIILDSKVKLTNLSQDKYESTFGEAFWKSFEDTEKEEYGNDFKTFMQKYYEGRPYSPLPRGLILSGGVLNFEQSRIVIKGYKVGIYAQGESYFKLHKGVLAKIKASKVAFLAVSAVDVSPFANSDSFSSFGKNVQGATLSNYLTGRGNQLFTFSSGKVEVGELAADASSIMLVDAMEGAARNIRLQTSGAIPVWVVVLLFFACIVVVLVALALVLTFALPKPEAKKKETEEAKADEA